jgi:CRISPR/Cas system-associated exonuclease Cas4 (RecB family)
MIVEKIDSSKEAKICLYPTHANRASCLGHPCTRYLVYKRTKWDEQIPHNVGLQYIFDLGNEFEKIALQELAQAGFSIIEQQRTLAYKDANITGHIDGLIQIDGELYPIDIKSIHPFLFDKINTIHDIINSKYWHIKGYYTQMQLYLFMNKKDKGYLLFKNKTTGRYKEIEVLYDQKHIDETIKKAKAIERHIESNTLPDTIAWSTECERCPFKHLCENTTSYDGLSFIDDSELEQMINRSKR